MTCKASSKTIAHTPSRDEISAVVPEFILELLGPPPLLASESPIRFQRFLTQFVVDLDPKSITEWMLLGDVVNVSWEIQRYRRAKTTLLKLSCPKVADELFLDNMLAQHKLEQFLVRDSAEYRDLKRTTGKEFDASSIAEGLRLDDLYDAALLHNMDLVERLDKMIGTLENRRDRLYRQLREHKSLKGNSESKCKSTPTVDLSTGS